MPGAYPRGLGRARAWTDSHTYSDTSGNLQANYPHLHVFGKWRSKAELLEETTHAISTHGITCLINHHETIYFIIFIMFIRLEF